ncbi:S-layer homology domain-containing protein [Maledivibacter halophilus]|uniref:S-layer homology domain-containing protein n=1 Tax=Maledivibacter halophilus TaxID=36842 RepID=A0A1T5M5E5_9FIRM|nr:S-layer homology domain-containing protein [Maledivibacter halophilus]SKC83467.1 S-layer homology domain-containing protein [Maledivibacter halophilus]
MKKRAILLLAMIMIMSMSIMSFANEAQFTKIEFIKEVLDAEEVEINELKESNYEGVVSEEYLPYIEAAYEKDIILKDEEFDPNSSITKEEAIIILVKVFGERTRVEDITEETVHKEIDFIDKEAVSTSAEKNIAYALKNDIIKKNRGAFYPVMPLDQKMSKEMIDYAKEAHEKYFTRNGLSADDILEMANENLKEQKTFKANGKMDVDMKMSIEGLPEDIKEQEALTDDQMNMKMNMEFDIQTENPDRSYVKQVLKTNADGVETEETTEGFIDGNTMYQKMSLSGDKWIKTDISSIQSQIQSLQGNDPQNIVEVSDKELMFYKNYASYGENEKIDGKEYYVINVDIDKEAYKKFMKDYMGEIMNASIDLSLQQQSEIDNLQEDAAEMDMVKEGVKQMIDDMDMEMSSKYYINKKTMNYEKVDTDATMYMNMDKFMELIAQMAEKDEAIDLSNVKMNMVYNMKGQFNYYDLGEEVIFPEITEDDIFKMEDKKLEQN